MKKIISLFLALMLFAFPLVSCGKDEGEDNNDQSVNDEANKEPEIELPGVNFLEDDLSEYIEISEEYYKSFDVLVDPGRINMLEVENKIIQTLRSYKYSKEIEGDGVISVGDVAHIYYKGYYMKDGEPYFFSGGDNTAEASPYALEIGSGGFILGFEYNLIGKNPADYNEDNPLVVETFFPENYQAAELAGKTAYFIVTVAKLVEYDAPELNDAFVSEKLQLDEEDLKEYEGETLTEKYRSYVKEQVLIENGLDIDSLVMDALWTRSGSLSASTLLLRNIPKSSLRRRMTPLWRSSSITMSTTLITTDTSITPLCAFISDLRWDLIGRST